MERVTFDRPLTPTELAQLTEFMALHPELAGLHVALNFKGIQDNTKLPFGTVAEFDRKTQVPLSFLPANMSHVNALFEIDEPFSELAFLRNDRLQEQTKAFQSTLGQGPSLADIAYKHVLPESLGKDLHSWVPFLGKGHISIVPNPDSPEDNQRFLLHVAVPQLPVVAQLFTNAYYKSDVPAAQELAQHPAGLIAREISARNACKIASLFAQSFNISLRHRRPNLQEKKGTVLPVPAALSMNPGPVAVDENTVKIASGLVAWGHDPQCGDRAVYSIGPAHAVLIAKRPSRTFLPYTAAKTGQQNKAGREIGHSFLAERVFTGSPLADSTVLHQRIINAQKNKELEEFISKTLGGPGNVAFSKPRMLFLHK
jgi:hypothetical protein